MLGEDLPESEASLLYDWYFSGVQLQPSNQEHIDELECFLKALEDHRKDQNHDDEENVGRNSADQFSVSNFL